MQILIGCITVLLCLFVKNTHAQPPVLNPITTRHPLHIGDKVPDIILSNIYNYTAEKVSLSTFRGKLLLIDFWATYCATCIQKMDHLEQLIKRYPNRLQVLLVSTAGNADSRQRISSFYTRVKNSAGRRYSLPVAINDTALSRIFPNRLLPHLVWINGEQQVVAITGSEALTTQNIEAVLKGEKPVYRLKEDYIDFKPAKGLFREGNGGNGDNFLFRTIVTPNVLGIPSSSSMQQDDSGKVTRITHANATLLFLITQSIDSDLPFSHIDMSKAGSDLDYRGKDAQWLANNSYCYEMVMPPATYPAAKRMMQQDIERYFGLSTTVKSVPTDCYVLKADTAMLSRFVTKSGKSRNTLYEKTGRQLRNYPVIRLCEYLDVVLPVPVVNETSFCLPLDLDLPDNTAMDITGLNKALQPCGLTLVPASRIQPILFITQTSLNQ